MSTIGPPVPPHFLDEVRSRVSLPSLIGRHVTPKRSSSALRGPCPIHGRANASNSSVRNGSCRCFVCGEHGEAIIFVMWADRLTFPKAAPKQGRILTEISGHLLGERAA